MQAHAHGSHFSVFIRPPQPNGSGALILRHRRHDSMPFVPHAKARIDAVCRSRQKFSFLRPISSVRTTAGPRLRPRAKRDGSCDTVSSVFFPFYRLIYPCFICPCAARGGVPSLSLRPRQYQLIFLMIFRRCSPRAATKARRRDPRPRFPPPALDANRSKAASGDHQGDEGRADKHHRRIRSCSSECGGAGGARRCRSRRPRASRPGGERRRPEVWGLQARTRRRRCGLRGGDARAVFSHRDPRIIR